jgi:hypothetical protein
MVMPELSLLSDMANRVKGDVAKTRRANRWVGAREKDWTLQSARQKARRTARIDRAITDDAGGCRVFGDAPGMTTERVRKHARE